MFSPLPFGTRYIAVDSLTGTVLATGRLAIEALAKADLLAPHAEIEIISVTSNHEEVSAKGAMKKVLIAEDDLLMADMLEEVLSDHGYDVCGIARTADQGVALAELHRPDLLLLDLRLAGGSFGTEITQRIEMRHDMGVIYISGTTNKVKLGWEHGHGVLRKPFRPDEVLQALKIVEAVVREQSGTIPLPSNFKLLHPAGIGRSSPAYSEGIERLLRQQAGLTGFGTYALEEQDLSKILQEAARVSADCLSVPFSKICRYRNEENDLIVEAGIGWGAGVVGHVVSRADKSSPQGRAFITGEAVICDNIGLDTSYILPAFYIEHHIISTLDVVIKKRDGTPWGVLEIDNPRAHQYDEHDVTFMKGFANILAEAVETAKRNQATKAALELLNDVVAERDRLIHAQARLLAERGELAQELQHRVRNNLQLVYGMLNRQIEQREENFDRSGISAIARRVMTLAKVYDHLLGTDLAKTTDFGSYLTSLCNSFADLQNIATPGIVLVCHADSLMLDLDTSTALGLVVAELISNSYMHAFPVKSGTVKVSLRHFPEEGIGWLDFADDGIGFSPKAESKRRGIGLVKRLMEQVDGEALLQSDQGTIWPLKFPVPDAVDEAA